MKKAIVWVWGEFKEMLPAMLFFLITFHMISITKAVILKTYHLDLENASTATVAAMILAKAILVVDKLAFSRCFERVVWHNILWKALLFYVVTAFFHILESLISHYHEYRSFPLDGSALTEWISWPYFLVLQMWLIALILLYTGLREMGQVIGRRSLIRLLKGPKPTSFEL